MNRIRRCVVRKHRQNGLAGPNNAGGIRGTNAANLIFQRFSLALRAVSKGDLVARALDHGP